MAVKKVPGDALADRAVQWKPLSDLLLDPSNPRFGDHAGSADQSAIVERIVTQFGIDDLLASLSVNGYFNSEPLVARRDGTKLVVVEGNRRLAACLILAGDPRAQAFNHRRPASPSHAWAPKSKVPVLVFEPSETPKLLPYLGVRHIVGSQAWDSYAKARWIHLVTKDGTMTLEDVAAAIGDSNRTVFRMLDGYHFINQLISEGRFKPEQSSRKGRGSNPEYPFSWVYTLLDNSGVRDYLELPPRAQVKAAPIPTRQLASAAKAVTYMFGGDGTPPRVSDSRQLSDLADALSDPIKRNLLERGHSVSDIVRLSRTAPEQLADQLRIADENLRNAVALLSADPIGPAEAEPFVKPAHQVRQLAVDLYKRLSSIALPEVDAST